MKFLIGVIVYNPDISVLKRLENYNKVCDNIIIYDNSELKNAISKLLSEKFQKYYWAEGNKGLSLAITHFFEISEKDDADILLTMDQDSLFKNDDIIKMLKKIQRDNDQEYLIYCPNYRKLYLDNQNNKVPGNYKIELEKEVDVNFCMTSGSFYKVLEIKKYFPINNLFIGYVDQQLCFRVIDSGKKIKMVGDITFDQEVGKIVKSNVFNKFFKIVHHKPIRYRYMFRNNFILQKEFSHNFTIKKTLLFDILRLSFNVFIGEKEKLPKVISCINGYKDYTLGKTGKIEEEK